MKALSLPILGHLDPEFQKMMDEICDLLRYVFQTSNKMTIPISGTGTAGMESTVSCVAEPGRKMLVAVAGYFAERLAEMGRRHGAEVHTIHKPWGQTFSLQEIEKEISSFKPDIFAIV